MLCGGAMLQRMILVIVSTLAAIVQSSITGPDRRVALVGFSLHLTCWTDSPEVCWEYYPDRSSIPQTIYTGQHLNSQYTASHRVTVGGGNVTLSVMSVQLRDAGVYQCRECSAVHSVDIEVIVLDGVCVTNSSWLPILYSRESYRTEVTCHFRYSGKWSSQDESTIQCHPRSGPGHIFYNQSTPETFIYGKTISWENTEDVTNFNCTVTGVDIPTKHLVAESTSLGVLITPSTQSEFTRVDQLLCTTSLTQTTATYSWKDLVTQDIIGTEDRLDLSALCGTTAVNPGDSRSVQCTASVRHELVGTITASSNISFNVSVNDYCNTTSGQYAGRVRDGMFQGDGGGMNIRAFYQGLLIIVAVSAVVFGVAVLVFSVVGLCRLTACKLNDGTRKRGARKDNEAFYETVRQENRQVAAYSRVLVHVPRDQHPPPSSHDSHDYITIIG